MKVSFKCFKCGNKKVICGHKYPDIHYFCFNCKVETPNRKYCENCLSKELEGLDRIRELVRMRDKKTCQRCLEKWKKGMRRFDVHHLDKRLEGRRNKKGAYKIDKKNMDRMITYCHKCHLNLDSVRYKMILASRA